MTARERLLKKRPCKVEVNGEEFTVRALTIAETIQVTALSEAGKHQESMNFILGSAMLEDDGKQMFANPEDPAINDVPMDLIPGLCDKIGNLAKSKSVAALEKNSDATP